MAENGQNTFTLEAGGSRFEVKSGVQLAPGQSLNLQVLATEPKIELQITGDTVSSLFSRALTSLGNNQDLGSFFTLLQQVEPSQLANLSNSSLQTLQDFAQLLQQLVPEQQTSHPLQATTGQSVSATEYGPKVLQQVFTQLGTRIANLIADGQGQAALASVKSALQDIALLFQEKEQIPQQALPQLEQLSPSTKQLFDAISQLQSNSDASPDAKEAIFNQLFQHVQMQPGTALSTANSAPVLNTLKSGLFEIVFLMKNPENLLQLFSSDSLQSDLLTQAQAEALLLPQGGAESPENTAGQMLHRLVNKLGLNLEGMLAAGNKEEAATTVKSALTELVQNFTQQSKLTETGKHALNSLEFFQLAQLQTFRQDAFVIPLPLPFLQQGYLVIEDYKQQSQQGGGESEMPKHFSLYLKLSPLGNLKIDFLYSGEGVYIRFNSDSKEVSDFIASFKDELGNALKDTPVYGVSFTENAEDPLSAVLKISRAGANSMINTKA